MHSTGVFPVGSLTPQKPNLDLSYILYSEIEFRPDLPVIVTVFEEQVDLIVDTAFPEVAEFRRFLDVQVSREIATMVSVFHVKRGDIFIPVCAVYIGQKMKKRKTKALEFGSTAFYRMLNIRLSVAIKRLRSMRFEEAIMLLPGRFHPDNLRKDPHHDREEEIFVRTATATAIVANGSLDGYLGRPDPRLHTLQFAHFGEQQSRKTLPHFFRRALGSGILMGQAVAEARRFILLPPNEKSPLRLAEHFLGTELKPEMFSNEKPWHDIRRHRFGPSVKASIIYGVKRLSSAGFGGIVGIGKGSQYEPCLLKLHYTPKNKKENTKRIVLAGKGVVFDTGGTSLKPSDQMEHMHYDMSGAATVVSNIKLAVEKKLQVEVVALLPLVDNAIGPQSIRPGEIVKLYNGLTVQITDTDSEGRVILADAVAFSEKHLKPYCTVTVATLSDMSDFGPDFLKVATTGDDLDEKVTKAKRSSYEKVMPFPQIEELCEVTPLLIGTVSDHKNDIPWHYHSAPFMFIWDHFEWEGTKWVHLDVATVFENDADDYGAGPGFGVRFLHELVKQFAHRHP